MMCLILGNVVMSLFDERVTSPDSIDFKPSRLSIWSHGSTEEGDSNERRPKYAATQTPLLIATVPF